MLTEEEIKKNLNFEKTIPAPIPGPFYMEMTPQIDTKSHSSALDADFKKIHTPITEFFPIDVLAEMRNLENSKNETWLRQGTQIDSLFYQVKSDRNELLMRDEQKSNIQEVLDYQSYLVNTFEQAKEHIDQIEEEYPLVPSSIEYSVFVGQKESTGEFKIEKGETTLFDKLILDNSVYNSSKLRMEDKICIEIRDGVAFYSPISYLYRLYEHKN
jgi:hypothetical protein